MFKIKNKRLKLWLSTLLYIFVIKKQISNVQCKSYIASESKDCDEIEAITDELGLTIDSWPINKNELFSMECCSYINIECGIINDKERVIELHINNNNITGPIPDDIIKLEQLKILSFKNNKLSGILPENISKLTNLESLDLSENEFTDSIPSQYKELKKLTTLVLSHNKLSGTIPEWIENFQELRKLWLDNNNFEGVIPTNFNKLIKLESLQLNNNSFEGDLTFLKDLDNLILLNLSNNNFYGEIQDLSTSMKNCYLSNNNSTLCLNVDVKFKSDIDFCYPQYFYDSDSKEALIMRVEVCAVIGIFFTIVSTAFFVQTKLKDFQFDLINFNFEPRFVEDINNENGDNNSALDDRSYQVIYPKKGFLHRSLYMSGIFGFNTDASGSQTLNTFNGMNYGSIQNINYGSVQNINYGSVQNINYGSVQNINYGSVQNINYGSVQNMNSRSPSSYLANKKVKIFNGMRGSKDSFAQSMHDKILFKSKSHISNNDLTNNYNELTSSPESFSPVSPRHNNNDEDNDDIQPLKDPYYNSPLSDRRHSCLSDRRYSCISDRRHSYYREGSISSDISQNDNNNSSCTRNVLIPNQRRISLKNGLNTSIYNNKEESIYSERNSPGYNDDKENLIQHDDYYDQNNTSPIEKNNINNIRPLEIIKESNTTYSTEIRNENITTNLNDLLDEDNEVNNNENDINSNEINNDIPKKMNNENYTSPLINTMNIYDENIYSINSINNDEINNSNCNENNIENNNEYSNENSNNNINSSINANTNNNISTDNSMNHIYDISGFTNAPIIVKSNYSTIVISHTNSNKNESAKLNHSQSAELLKNISSANFNNISTTTNNNINNLNENENNNVTRLKNALSNNNSGFNPTLELLLKKNNSGLLSLKNGKSAYDMSIASSNFVSAYSKEPDGNSSEYSGDATNNINNNKERIFSDHTTFVSITNSNLTTPPLDTISTISHSFKSVENDDTENHENTKA